MSARMAVQFPDSDAHTNSILARNTGKYPSIGYSAGSGHPRARSS
jgi:hypothetical protein